MGFLGFLLLVLGISSSADSAIFELTHREVSSINSKGPYIGIVVPNAFEMDPLLQSPIFVPDHNFPYFDFGGRHFRVGHLGKKRVIIIRTGMSMPNADLSTQLLLTLFEVKGVVHYGIAGNANPKLQIGDVTIPQYWAHTGVWNWQRFGDGPNDEIALEAKGDSNKRIGYLKFSNDNNHTNLPTNILSNVWYEADEIFPVKANPQVREHAFWVPVDKTYFEIARKLEDMKLGNCENTACLPRRAIVVRVKRGFTANVFVDNNAYRESLNSKFNATPIDNESAAVALVCLQKKMPFIAIRALSNLAAGLPALSNEAYFFDSLASQNAVHVVIKFISLLSF